MRDAVTRTLCPGNRHTQGAGSPHSGHMDSADLVAVLRESGAVEAGREGRGDRLEGVGIRLEDVLVDVVVARPAV